MHRRYTHILLLIALLLNMSCTDTQSRQGRTSLTRLDLILAEYAQCDTTMRAEILRNYGRDIDAMFAVLGRGVPSPDEIMEWSRSPVVTVFQPAVDSVYRNTDELQRQLSYMLTQAHDNGLTLPPLDFCTVVWGNPRPIVRVESTVLVALNHYLGVDYPGYARWERYRRAVKTPAMLPYDLAGALAATQHPMSGGDHALIEWMLYEGALLRARMLMVRDADMATALGYTPQQMQMAHDNLQPMWRELAMKKVIFDSGTAIIDRYISPAPDSPLLGGRAPGRVCCYIGYMIVESYVQRHGDPGLDHLLSPAFYANQQSLIDSGFTGR